MKGHVPAVREKAVNIYQYNIRVITNMNEGLHAWIVE